VSPTSLVVEFILFVHSCQTRLKLLAHAQRSGVQCVPPGLCELLPLAFTRPRDDLGYTAAWGGSASEGTFRDVGRLSTRISVVTFELYHTERSMQSNFHHLLKLLAGRLTE
jgi:hypothetical protein